MDLSAEAVIAFLQRHQDWSFPVAMIFAAAETTAFLSLLVPSTAILVAVGGAVAAGAFAFLPIWAGAAIGAVLGSTFSWWLGRRYGVWMLTVWPLRDHPALVERAAESFRTWGGLAVFLGHFIGPLRPVVFLFAGMTRMGFWRFQALNLPGALAWAYAVPKFGEIGGLILAWIWRILGI